MYIISISLTLCNKHTEHTTSLYFSFFRASIMSSKVSKVTGKDKDMIIADGGTPSYLVDFGKFYRNWVSEQEKLLHKLLFVASYLEKRSDKAEKQVKETKALINHVVCHYEDYYRAKSASANINVLPMFTPNWTSKTENLFQWIGGWLPSAAFQLIFSTRGLRMLTRLDDLLKEIHMGDLVDLTEQQSKQLDELKRRIVRSEMDITEEAAIVQSTVANSSVVSLTHAITELKLKSGGEEVEPSTKDEMEMEMDMEMKWRTDGMSMLLRKADGLRMDALRGIIDILEPLQAVHFLIAAAELHLRVHEWGVKMDEAAAGRPGGGCDRGEKGKGKDGDVNLGRDGTSQMTSESPSSLPREKKKRKQIDGFGSPLS